MSTNPLPPTPPRRFSPPTDGDVITTARGKRYMLGAEIGRGNFGAVFGCADEWGNDLVAKVLLPQSRTYDEVREEWLHELTNLENLRHPNITYIHDAFECNDTFYLVVERCTFTLEDLIGPPDIDGEIWLPYVARDVLHALEYIHHHGYVHKDLHPGNIFISEIRDRMVPDSHVWQFKIGDLGISRLEGDIRLFNTILAQWMLPPEFLNPHEFGVVGRHVDIYHTGLLLLGLLLGRTPTFTHQDILDGRPRETAESLSSPYAPAIARALRRHVVYRTQSPIEMWREILSCVGSGVTTA